MTRQCIRDTSYARGLKSSLSTRGGCTCVICGLGSIEQAHQPDEFVDPKFFSDHIADKYEQLVREFCATDTKGEIA